MAFSKTGLAVLVLTLTTESWGVFTPPQVQALQSLQAQSATPVRVQFHNGFPVDLQISLNRSTIDGDPVAAARAFLTEFAPLWGLDRPEIELAYVRIESAAAGRMLVRFAETFRRVPVVDADLVVDLRMQGFVATILGTRGTLMLAASIDTDPAFPVEIDLVPAITAAMAESAARTAIGLSGAEISGETILMVHDPRIGQGEGDPRLVWRVTLIRHGARQLLVDANTAEVLRTSSLLDAHGPGDDDPLEDFDLQLDDALGGNAGVSCYWFTETDSIGDAGGIDSDYSGDPDAVAAYWAAHDTYLMFHEQLGRHSYDDDDAQLETWVHTVFPPPPASPSEPNASGGSWCGIQFSTGWVSLDVMAHEYAHMVIDETSDLGPRNQQGALNESFADMMGHLADPLDWYIGEERTLNIGAQDIRWIRHMADPTDRFCAMPGCTDCMLGCCAPCPDRYSLYFPLPPDEDSGGVHVNANIVNKAFYLMNTGESFNGRPAFSPLTLGQAGRLAYDTFTGLGSQPYFSSARNHAVAVAETFASQGLHGFDAVDVCAVRNAFRAVEIGRGDLDCDGVDDDPLDEDGDGILNDGDESGSATDHPCHPVASWFSFETWNCDDNCPFVPNPTQRDLNGDGIGDLCDDDVDGDGIPNDYDPCVGVPNEGLHYLVTPEGNISVIFDDTDGDGLIDCLDDDDDDDGILDDGDGSGDPDDNPCASEVTTDCDDNCQDDPNPSQYDGNDNGDGDACDPDWDGDDLYVLEDNCTFVTNAGQEDTDGDGIGDACDLCPNTPDSVNAYTPGYPELGTDPVPYQPDSDGDGVPDACDPFAFGQFGALYQGSPYSRFDAIEANGLTRQIQVNGTAGAGGRVRLVLPVCETPLAASERVDLYFSGMPTTLSGWVEDDSGRPVERLRTHNAFPARRGLRFKPRCDRAYAVALVTETGFTGSASFFVRASVVTPTGENPYASNTAQYGPPPPRPPDQDGDGFQDAIDNCPADFDPDGLDADGDAVGDVCDNCPDVANPGQGLVEFPTVRALDGVTFGWDGSHDYNWVSGALDSLHSGSPFADLGPGGTGSGDTLPLAAADPLCAGTSCWLLWKHTRGGCGTWGRAERDAAIPTFCAVYADCAAGESCIDGRCVTPLEPAACP